MTKIPEDLIKALEKWKIRRTIYENSIKERTDDWIRAQKKIIELQDAIDVLGK